jgi:hypothetical protein
VVKVVLIMVFVIHIQLNQFVMLQIQLNNLLDVNGIIINVDKDNVKIYKEYQIQIVINNNKDVKVMEYLVLNQFMNVLFLMEIKHFVYQIVNLIHVSI